MSNVFGTVIFTIIIVVAAAFIVGFPVMLMINYLFSEQALEFVFGSAKIGFWKAFWVSILCGILVGSSSSK